MKLNLLKRKGKLSIASRDSGLLHKSKIRLTKISESVRREQLKSAPVEVVAKKRDEEVRPASRVKLTITRKAHFKEPDADLTLNSDAALKEAGRPAEQVLWKARRLHGRHLPSLQCNACSISRVCPKFKAGYECAFLPYLNSHKVETPADLVKYMKLMVGNSMKRAQLMSIIETANGGMPSTETSESLALAFQQLRDLHELMSANEEETVTLEGDATIVGQIFGGMKLETMVKETADMKQNEPQLALPEVPLAQGDIMAPRPADISEELIRDAVLGSTVVIDSKKGLPKPAIASIHQSEVTRTT